MPDRKGKVFIIGAGPGDPKLITLRGKELIERADVILYDYLVAKELLTYAKKSCEIVYVGKKAGKHTMPQEEINALLCEKALPGKTVVRLKGGDPFVFGRGGEEVIALEEKKIPFEIVPGITAAIASPAYSGIPVTHRDYTQTFTLVTGHEADDKEKGRIPWKSLAELGGTIAFYMGVKNMESNLKKLIENGMDKNTPCAFIRWGTTSDQKTFTGTIENIKNHIPEEFYRPPAMILIGGVVNLREKMRWFEAKPLFGKSFLVTRSREQASVLVELLAENGGQCFELPTIKIEPPLDFSPLDQAIENLERYDWVIFTSVNGVTFFNERLKETGKDSRALSDILIGSIGPATTLKLEELGIKADFQPSRYQSDLIAKEITKDFNVTGKRILLARSDIAPMDLVGDLEAEGAEVNNVTAYRTQAVENSKEEFREKIAAGEIDCFTFTASSTVRNFFNWYGEGNFKKLKKKPVIASIGPVTSNAIKDFGFSPTVEARESTIPALVDSIKDYYSNEGR